MFALRVLVILKDTSGGKGRRKGKEKGGGIFLVALLGAPAVPCPSLPSPAVPCCSTSLELQSKAGCVGDM